MALQALINSSGNVLKNTDGRILKANYNFGRSLYFPSNSTCYIDVPYMIGKSMLNRTFFTTVWKPYGYSVDNSQVGVFRILLTDPTTGKQIITTDGQYGSSQWHVAFRLPGGSVNNTLNSFIVPAGFHHHATCFDENNFIRMNDASIYKENNTTHMSFANYMKDNPNMLIAEFELNVMTTSGMGTVGRRYSRTTKHALLRCYNRTLSDAELRHNYNNSLGNEPLNKSGMELEYRFNLAEVLDFSAAQDGSDMRVGIRNFGVVPYAHGHIVGLPAGTLEYQVTWANNNLFADF